MVYNSEERIFIIENCFKTGSYLKVRNLFIEKFNKNGPNDSYINKLIAKFRSTGSIKDRKHGRVRTVLIPQKLEEIKEDFIRSPNKPLKPRAQAT